MHFVKVDKTIKHEKLGEQKVTFKQAPQADNTEELVNIYGGEKEFVDRINKILARAATQTSVLRLQGSNATTQAEFDAAVEKEQQAVKDYKPEITTGVSAKVAKTGVDALTELATKNAELFKQMTPDEVLAYLTSQELPERLRQAA
jgi:hypothetical protein